MVGYSIDLHVRCLLNAWAEVLLLDGDHFTLGNNLAGFEHLFDLRFVGQVLVLKIDVISLVVWSDLVVSLLVLDPSVVHERIFNDLLKLSSVLHDLALGCSVVDSEGDLKASLTSTLPQILTIFLSLCVVELSETAKSDELLTTWRLVLLVDRCQVTLNLGASVADDEASEAVLHNVLVGHVKFVHKLSSVGSNSLLDLVALTLRISIVHFYFLLINN